MKHKTLFLSLAGALLLTFGAQAQEIMRRDQNGYTYYSKEVTFYSGTPEVERARVKANNVGGETVTFPFETRVHYGTVPGTGIDISQRGFQRNTTFTFKAPGYKVATVSVPGISTETEFTVSFAKKNPRPKKK